MYYISKIDIKVPYLRNILLIDISTIRQKNWSIHECNIKVGSDTASKSYFPLEVILFNNDLKNVFRYYYITSPL